MQKYLKKTSEMPLVTDLGYADDVALCAPLQAKLRALIDRFCTYCADNGLIVNRAKCKAIMHGVWQRRCLACQRGWTLQSADGVRMPMAMVGKFKYLGLELHGA